MSVRSFFVLTFLLAGCSPETENPWELLASRPDTTDTGDIETAATEKDVAIKIAVGRCTILATGTFGGGEDIYGSEVTGPVTLSWNDPRADGDYLDWWVELDCLPDANVARGRWPEIEVLASGGADWHCDWRDETISPPAGSPPCAEGESRVFVYAP